MDAVAANENHAYDKLIKIKEINLWDIFFTLRHILFNEDYNNWCDVEREMTKSFEQINDGDHKYSFWSAIYCYLYDNNDYSSDSIDPSDDIKLFHESYLIFAEIIKRILKLNNIFFSEVSYEDYILFLLSELNLFEKRFANFLKFQMESYGTHYSKQSLETLCYLCDTTKIVSIDSFNFHNIDGRLVKPTVNINGLWENSIFGVDDSIGYENLNSPEYYFTKSFRQINILLKGLKPIQNLPNFDNAIIYGHSLSESDFGYFFSIFDKLKLNDANADNKIVFAYSIYDEKRREAIILDLNKRINNIIKQYCIDRKINTRLISSLIAMNRLLVLEVPVIEKLN